MYVLHFCVQITDRCKARYQAFDKGVCMFAVQVLNNYVASLTQEQHIDAAWVIFWLLDGSSLSRVDAELPAHGSLGPLFHAFGLISDEELRSGAGSYLTGELRVSACSCTGEIYKRTSFPHCLCAVRRSTATVMVCTLRSEHTVLLSRTCNPCIAISSGCLRSLG